MPTQGPLPYLSSPVLLDPESSIPKAAEALFSCAAGERYALVQKAFAPDATYYNSFVRLPCPPPCPVVEPHDAPHGTLCAMPCSTRMHSGHATALAATCV